MPPPRTKPGNTWPLQDAKNRLSEVVNQAQRGGAQIITRRGVAAAVVLSFDEYEELSRPSGSLAEFLMDSPLRGSGLELTRSRDPGRKVDL
jgi:antitoxin Phd